jgi:hypothetical protein
MAATAFLRELLLRTFGPVLLRSRTRTPDAVDYKGGQGGRMNSLAFRGAEYVYSAPRRLKNRLLNMLDEPVVVLLYHRINSLSEDPYLLAVTPENFRAQILFLKQNFDIVRFGIGQV